MTRGYIRGIAYELGALQSIDELEELKTNPELLLSFRQNGLRMFGRADASPAQLALACARRTLSQAGVDASEVDLLIYATTSFYEEDFYRADIGEMATKLGLKSAYPIAISLSECANIISALQVAVNAICSQELKNVLIVTTDCQKAGASRIVSPNISVYSDAACSCLVTAERGEFAIEALFQHVNFQLWNLNSGRETVAYFVGMSQGVHKVCRTLFSAVNAQPSDFIQLCSNHYNESVVNTLAFQSGFEMDRIYRDNISRFGHAYSADPLINLSDAFSADPAPPLSRYLLLATGPSTWGGAVLSVAG
jgi:3-oxoacyl-[acyl-carrier-protein] synthase III